MFGNGNILHIQQYEFEDGTVKDTGKFLVVIFNNKDISIIASLTTSQNHVPDEIMNHGCINLKKIRISCYHYSKSKIITDNNFAFNKDTFIYFAGNVFEKQITVLENKYKNKIELKGKLTETEYKELVYCVYKSSFTNNKIKKILEKHLEKLFA